MNPVKITDTTLRDGHQSLMATRLRTSDMQPIAESMNEAGFHSMEVWGGATFDTTTRFLGEDPWERLRILKNLIPDTPLMMLLRGQSLVGYRNYADDVVDAFIQKSAENGIDIFRVFDALNDERNLRKSADAVKKSGKHLQMTVCYSVTEEGKMGGPIYNLNYYINKAEIFQNMGADSLCVKDMAGLLNPFDSFELFTALKNTLEIPIQLHTHYTSGMASMTALKAIEADLDIVDTCLAPLALRSAQPAVEPLVMTLQGTDRDTGLDLDKLIKLSDYFESILPKYKDLMESPRAAVIDTRVLNHQIPGGMISNLTSQLKEAGALNKLIDVLEEIPRTRKDLGYPPLVTPISQMIGTQAVSNVLFGSYKMMSEQIKNYIRGLYGQPPAPINPEIVNLALKNYGNGQDQIHDRPPNLIDPELDKATEEIKHISTDMEDVLTYALYPTTGMKFLREKHGLDNPFPNDTKSSDKQLPSTEIYETRTFNVSVDGKHYQVEVEPIETNKSSQHTEISNERPSNPNSTESSNRLSNSEKSKQKELTIVAPIPGILVKYTVQIGQTVEPGDTVVILEAMKMENSLPSIASGKITSLPFTNGANVSRGDVLAVITPYEK